MSLDDPRLHRAGYTSKNYAEFVMKLEAMGIRGYTVDVSSQVCIYRLADNTTLVDTNNQQKTVFVQKIFDIEKVKKAVIKMDESPYMNPACGSFYLFLEEVGEAGVQVIFADFDAREAFYYGPHNVYSEKIPFPQG